MSTTGFEARPGTAVEPMWWIPPSSQGASTCSNSARSRSKRRAHSGSYGTRITGSADGRELGGTEVPVAFAAVDRHRRSQHLGGVGAQVVGLLAPGASERRDLLPHRPSLAVVLHEVDEELGRLLCPEAAAESEH